MDYKSSGVDVEAGRAFISKIKSSVESTHRSEVIGGIGGFGGFIRLPEGFSQPVLVAGTDGVGTKLELAQDYQQHFGVGVDLVAMCVNDVITSGAKPLFFLDYIATGSLGPVAMTEVIKGIAEGCRKSECSLLGGETAEMPGFYSPGKYDLAGFCVAVVEKSLIIDGSKTKIGDQIIAIESSGVHSNGFSLVRKILASNQVDEQTLFGTNKQNLIKALLEPTQLYGQLVQNLLENSIPINGMAHITGGGLPENLPRCLPKGLIAYIDPSTWQKPELFHWLQSVGNIPERDLWNTFNLGVGFCLIVPSEDINAALEVCSEIGLKAWSMGSVQEASNTHGQDLMGIPC